MAASDQRDIFQPGDLLNNTYRIVSLLGRGGTSEVYRAKSEISGRVVAVKALRELPQRTVQAYRMHCMEGLSCAEIGRRFNQSRSRAHALVEEAIVQVTIRLMDY